jgi:hypothetical protein
LQMLTMAKEKIFWKEVFAGEKAFKERMTGY